MDNKAGEKNMKKTTLFFLFICVSVFCYAQNTAGKIVGKVVENSSAKAISGETVLLFRDDVQFASARSSSSGNFSFVSVESGEYSLKIKRQGYQSYLKKIRINPNITTKLVVALEPIQQEKNLTAVTVKTEEKRVTENKPKNENSMGVKQPDGSNILLASNTQLDTSEKTAAVAPVDIEQITIDSNTEPEYYDAVEEMPEPVDGWSALMKNIEYPSDAAKLNIQGSVYLTAYVTKEGDVTNITVLKSIPMLDLSAQEAVYKTKFKPGVISDKVVDSKITIKVPFKLGK